MRSPLREGDVVVPNVTVAGCNEQCNGHVVKLLGRLNRRRRNPRATSSSSPSSSSAATARQLKGKDETKARGRLRATEWTARESETRDVGGKLQPPSCTWTEFLSGDIKTRECFDLFLLPVLRFSVFFFLQLPPPHVDKLFDNRRSDFNDLKIMRIWFVDNLEIA